MPCYTAVASDLTGPTKTLTLTSRPPTGVQAVTVTSATLLGSPSGTPGPREGSRKRLRQRAPSPSPLDEAEEITGTPRSVRVARLFPGGSGASAKPLTVLVQKLLEVLKATLIPKTKRAKAVSVDVESAADILALTGLIQEQASLMEARRVVFDPNCQTAPSPSPSSLNPHAQFEFRHESLSAKVDTLTEQVAKLVAVVVPNHQQPPSTQLGPAKSSYALAASAHAPRASSRSGPAQPSPRAPTRSHARPRSEACLTLTQQDPAHISGASKTIPEPIRSLNAVLKETDVRVTPEDAACITVRNIHRHPSNDLVVYLDSPKQALALRDQVSRWLPSVSPHLALKQEMHSIIVHGVPTTFNPARPEDVDLLKTCNGDLLDNALYVRWLRRETADDLSKRHSSLLIGFRTHAEASLAARTKVWQGRGRHRTELSAPPPTRCFNCQGAGHTEAACKLAPMCPHCAGEHHTHNCPVKGSSALKCVACARGKLKADPRTNLQTLFKDNHADFLHHPFATTCPMRIAGQSPPHNPSASPHIAVVAQTNSTRAQC